jgi:radical SAM protein with 4Fe4S-binding SPASM domain
VAAPFSTVYWSEVEKVVQELGLPHITGESLSQSPSQHVLLSALAEKLPGAEAFRPGTIGFKREAAEIRSREQFRASRCAVTFLGNCSRTVVLVTLNLLTRRLAEQNGAIDVQFKQWDALSDWRQGKERLRDVLNCLGLTEGRGGSLMFFSCLREIPDGFGEFIYDQPRVRLGWMASNLAQCGDMAQFERCLGEDVSLKNLETLANQGIWPHIVLPITPANTPNLSKLVPALAELTRGGTIDLVPAPLLNGGDDAPAPGVEEYVAALLAIYRDSRIPLRMVAPQSWVADRVESQSSMASSLDAAGAAVAVLANGDVYAGEAAVGLKDWHLGNILQEGEALRWERLDAVPEVFSASTKPEQCKACDWRYRCGGVDASVMLRREKSPATGWETLFELYCAPRLALFEEELWDSATDAAERNSPPPRDLIIFHENGISLQPAPSAPTN